MPTIHANTQLKTGDTVNGLSGLKDCESGRGINLRLDGKAVVPEEWAAPCSPPTISGGNHKIVSLYYAEYDGYAGTPYLSKTFFEKYIFPNDETRVRVLQSIIPNKFSNIMNDWPHPGVKEYFDGTKLFRSKLPNGQGYYIYRVVQSTTYLPKPSVAAWPPYIDSELIYDAASGRFKPACAQHDPHLPESLKNERRCLSLCDAEGNCVIIRRTERGIELWQEKYKQRALIDPATGKVLGVKYEKNRIVKELKLTFNDIEIKHNIIKQIIRIGEQAVLSASQSITVKLEGGIKLIKQHDIQILISGEKVGRAILNADSLCENRKIELDVKPSFKEEYLAALWPALENAGITRNKNELAAFLASSDVETHGGTSMREKLGYSLERWRELAKEGNQKNIQNWLNRHAVNTEVDFAQISIEDQLNIMYEGMNGNVEFGDGYKFRGRGGFHLTGRGNYYAFAKYVNRMDIMDNPDLLATDPDLAVKSAIWFWTKYRPELPELARQGDYKRVRRIVNGSTISIAEYNRLIQGYLSGKGALIRQ